MKAQTSFRPSNITQSFNQLPSLVNRKWLLWFGVVMFTLGTGFALYQPVHPDPWHVHDSWDRFVYPQEKNAFLRQFSVSTNININDVTAIEDKTWAVGDGGLILYSEDGGLCWVPMGPWVQSVGQAACSRPGTGLKRIFSGLSASLHERSFPDGLISNAYAAEPPAPPRSKQPFSSEPEKKTYNQSIQQNVEPVQNDTIPSPLDIDVEAKADTSVTNIEQNLAPQIDQIPDLLGIAFYDSIRGVAAGTNGHILKTEDGGISWRTIETGLNDTFISIQFETSEHIFAVTTEGRLFHSMDAGVNWSRFDQRSRLNFVAIEFNGNEYALALDVSGSIFRSEDGAQSWREVNPSARNRLNSIAISSQREAIAVGDNGTILHSNDAGLTWSPIRSTTQASLYAAAYAADRQVIAVGENGTTLRSTDSGLSWTISESNTEEILRSVTTLKDSKAIAVGIDGTILYSNNAGQTWAPIESGIRSRLYAIAFTSDSKALAVGAKDTIMASRDGGQSWKMASSNTPSRLYSVALSSANHALAVGRNGTILRSTDLGQSWESIDSKHRQRLYSVAFINPGEALAVGEGGLILRSIDAGTNWVKDSSNSSTRLNSVAISADDNAFSVGENGVILASTAAQNRWSIQRSGTTASLYSIGFSSNGIAIAVGSNGTVVRSEKSNENWTRSASGTRETLRSIAFSMNGTAIIVGDNGSILRSQDSGTNWNRIDSTTMSRLYAISFSPENRAIAVGRDGTILKSMDDGLSWQRVKNYSVSIANWWYLLLFSCVGLILFAAWPRQEQSDDPGIAGLAASDKPLQAGDPDALNLGSIAHDITTFLSNPRTTAPLTMAITGPWGSGKSSLMNLVRADLEKRGFSPVWFNAWHHQKGEQLLASLFAHIRQQAIPSWFSFDGLWFRIKLAFIRSYRHWFVFAILMGLLFFTISLNKPEIRSFMVKLMLLSDPDFWWDIPWENWMPNLQSFFQSGDWIQTLAGILGIGTPLVALIRSVRGFGINPRKLVSIDHRSDKSNAYDPGARARFAKEFNDVTRALGNNKMVIFIDDLDRCSQENLIDILENINFISSSGDCFMLLGMAPKYIEACVANAYETLAQSIAAKEKHDSKNHGEDEQTHKFRFAHNYLEKMINIEVTVPHMQANSFEQLFNLDSKKQEPQNWKNRVHSLFLSFNKSTTVVLPVFIILLAIAYGWEYGRKIPDKPETRPNAEYSLDAISHDQILALARDSSALQKTLKNMNETSTPTEPSANEFSLALRADEKQLQKGIKIASLGKGKEQADIILRLNPVTREIQLQDPVPSIEKDSVDTSISSEETSANRAAEFRQAAYETGGRLSGLKLLAGILLVSSFTFYLYRKKKDKYAEDSRDFKEALTTWTPWIQYKQETPRAVKRFLNHLRFLAIRNNRELHEPVLVAMATIYFYNPEWLLNEAKFKAICELQLNPLLADEYQLEKQDKDRYEQLKLALGSLAERLNEVLKKINVQELAENRERAISILSGTLPVTQHEEETANAEPGIVV
jgi:photosystem II stability/assembly factor-like uncharacterized protein